MNSTEKFWNHLQKKNPLQADFMGYLLQTIHNDYGKVYTKVTEKFPYCEVLSCKKKNGSHTKLASKGNFLTP